MKLYWCQALEQSKRPRKKVAGRLRQLVSLRPRMPVYPECLGALLRISSPRAGVAANVSIQTN